MKNLISLLNENVVSIPGNPLKKTQDTVKIDNFDLI